MSRIVFVVAALLALTVVISAEPHLPYVMWSVQEQSVYSRVAIDKSSTVGFVGVSLPNESIYTAFQFVAFDLGSGATIWNRTLDSFPGNNAYYYEGRAYIMTFLGHLYCCNATDGRLLWKSSFSEEFNAFTPTGGFVNGTTAIFVGSVAMYAVDASTGTVLWQFNAPAKVMANSYYDATSGNLYFGDGVGRFYSLDANSGTQNWEVMISGGTYAGPPTVYKGVALFGSTYNNAQALNASDGTILYTLPFLVQQRPVVNEDLDIVYWAVANGSIASTSFADGRTLWTYNLGSYILVSGLELRDGILFAGGVDALHAFDANSGRWMWNVTLPKFAGTPTADRKGRVFFGTTSNLPTNASLGLYGVRYGYGMIDEQMCTDASCTAGCRKARVPLGCSMMLPFGSVERTVTAGPSSTAHSLRVRQFSQSKSCDVSTPHITFEVLEYLCVSIPTGGSFRWHY